VRRRRHLTDAPVLFPILAALLLGVLWAATESAVRARRAGALEAARARVAEHLDTYEAQALRVLREIDRTLQLIEYERDHHGGTAAVADLAARGLLPPSLLFTVEVFDPEGGLVESNRASGAVDASNRDDFLAARADGGLAVGLPVLDPDTGAWHLRFSRPMRDDAGELSGVATVGVDAEFFVSGYEPADLGERGLLAVLGADGVIRARRTGDRVSAGGRIDGLAALEQEGEVVVAAGPWDGVERLTAARRIYGFPLAVVVGVAIDEVLTPAAADAATYRRRAVLGSLLLVGIVALLGRMSWQLQRARRREYEAKAAHAERVEYLADHDTLTGLPNRSLFSRLLEQAIRLAARHRRELAVMFIDLDRFKQINDTLGHDVGDELLREVARRLRSCLRESDSVARLGGDEFVVLLTEIDSQHDGRTVADKILAKIALPFTLLDQDFRITGSIGIATYPGHGLDEQTLTKNADIAMYRAKEEGKNNFQFYSDEINSNSLERLALEASLRRALEHGELELRYQAKRDACSGRITGIEALLRWQHSELATVAPRRFLALAEETGLIVPIGRWVLEHACRQNVKWQQQGLPRVGVSVNLSERQFYDEGLERDVGAALEASGMEPELLELEIGEEILMRNVSGTLDVLHRMRAMGVRIALDRFGVGYSSLTGLEGFPLDAIKIDRSFLHSPSAAAAGLTEALVALGRTLGLTVVGQGVETDEQAAFLRRCGCHELQGFHVHRPMRPDQLEELLREPDDPLVRSRFAAR
jgi:diguanylate cyclase (GGDEF)-like protein